MLQEGIGTLSQSLFSTLFGPSDKKHTAKAAVNATGRNCFWAVSLDKPMDEVLSILSHNVHRVAVIDPTIPNKLLGVITQSDVCFCWLDAQFPVLPCWFFFHDHRSFASLQRVDTCQALCQ
jgi:CBS-domain-containing membrane protein